MLTHLIQAPRSSLLFHFTDEESKAQREPMVWQSQEPTLPLNCQAPQPRSPCRVCKRQKGKPQPKKTVGSGQDELWSHEQVGMVQATLPERPKDLLQAAKKVPRCGAQGLGGSTSTGGRVSGCRGHRPVQTASEHSLQILRAVPCSPPPKAGLHRPQKPLSDMTSTPTQTDHAGVSQEGWFLSGCF